MHASNGSSRVTQRGEKMLSVSMPVVSTPPLPPITTGGAHNNCGGSESHAGAFALAVRRDREETRLGGRSQAIDHIRALTYVSLLPLHVHYYYRSWR